MEKILLDKFKKLLENEKNITDIELFYNLEGNWVITYKTNNNKYIIEINEVL